MALAGLACLVFAAVSLGGCGDGSQSNTAPAAAACNGSVRLCGRRLDQVVFPGTHNSYAASDQPGWQLAPQRFGIAHQLADGIRALLLDVHYGIPDPERGLVRTDFAAEGAEGNKVLETAPAAARRLAERLAGPIGVGLPPGRTGLYLCHTLCELGSEPLGQELRAIDSFLAAHPREVLVLIVEDYVPAARIARAFTRAGLAAQAATLDRHRPLPTLGSLIARDRHLVVFSEDRGGSPPWYMPAFSFIQDTPLGATRPSRLSCDRFRGEPDSPLLLVNHWIPPFPPSPRLNAAIGRATFLRHRLRSCMAARGTVGAIVAVDFYEQTAVVRVAEQLNGG